MATLKIEKQIVITDETGEVIISEKLFLGFVNKKPEKLFKQQLVIELYYHLSILKKALEVTRKYVEDTFKLSNVTLKYSFDDHITVYSYVQPIMKFSMRIEDVAKE